MSRYASCAGGPVSASREFKQMVKALHDAGIEVRLVLAWSLKSLLHIPIMSPLPFQMSI